MPESFTFGVPAITDANDGTTLYVMGTEFSTSANGSWTGVTWRVPNSVAANNHYVLAYAKTGASTGNFLGSKLFTPVPGGAQTILFNTPFAIVAGSSYVACVLTNHYVATTSYGWPVATAHMTAPSGSNGRLVTTSPDAEKFPSTISGTANNFFVSPVVVYIQTGAVGLATETDTAIGFGRAKTRALGLAGESDAAFAFARRKSRAVGLAGGTEIALPLGRVKSRVVGTVTQADFAAGLGRVKARMLGLTVETDQALPMQVPARPVGPRIVASSRPGRIVSTSPHGRITRGGGA